MFGRPTAPRVSLSKDDAESANDEQGEATLRNQSGAIQRQAALVIEPATGEKQDEKEHIMDTQLKPVSIITAIEQGRSKRFAQYTLVAAALAVLLMGAIAISQTFPHRSSAAIHHSGLTVQQRHFLEVNTTSLANAVMPDATPIAVPFERTRFLEVNTMLGMGASLSAPAYPYGEAVMPVRGPR